MLQRVTVAFLVVGGLISAGPAAAQTWDQAAGEVAFPVFEPARALGLRASVETAFCDASSSRSARAVYRRPGSRKRLRFSEYRRARCADAGESQVVKTVRIHHRTVKVRVSCHSPGPRCHVSDGRKNGWLMYLRRRGTIIQFTARHISLRALLRVARSLRRVDLTRPTVHLTGFLSPDRGIWCGIDADEAWCATKSGRFRGAVAADGTVSLCQDAGYPCIQNWDDSAPVLQAGQRTVFEGFACTAESAAMTCTVQGKGFHIDAAGVRAVPGP
jgi:hypothetical protein